MIAVLAVALMATLGCGGASAPRATAPAPVAAPKEAPAAAAAPAKEAPKPAAEAPKPAAQAPKPAAEPPKPAAQAPAKPASGSPPGEVRRIAWGPAPVVSPMYTYAVAAAKVINEKVPSVQVTVSETRGAVEGMSRLRSGQLAMLTTQLGLGYEAYKGLAQFKDQPVADLRVLWTSNVGMNVFVVRQDSGITTIPQLEGREFAGGTGTYTDVLAKNAFAAVSINPKWYRGGLEDALTATKDRRIVGFVKAVGATSPDGQILDVQTSSPIRLLGWTQDLIDKVKQSYEYYTDGVVPAGVYKSAGNDQAVRTWTALIVTVATKDMDPELAYQIVKAVDQNKEPQTAAFPPSGEVDFVKAVTEVSPLPVHAGVLRYVKERGLPVRPAIVPPEAK